MISLGRAPDNDLIFDPIERRASAHHAAIELGPGGYSLRDLNSKNGTYIGTERIARKSIGGGEIVEFGRRGPRILIQILNEGEQTLQHPSLSTDEEVVPATLSATLDPNRGSFEGFRRIGRHTMQFVVEAATRQASARMRRWFLAVVLLLLAAAVLTFYQLNIRTGRRPTGPAEVDSGDFTEVVAKNQRAVVLVQVQFQLVDELGRIIADGSSEGSGFLADSAGHLITNYHIVKPWEFDPELSTPKATVKSKTIRIIFADHRADEAIIAEAGAEDRAMDLAILKISPHKGLEKVQGFDPDMSHLRQGEEVAFVGFPLGSDLLRTTHQERATTTLIRTTISKVAQNVLQVEAPVYHGFSGSPILNRAGNVVGVLTARLGEAGESPQSGPRSIGIATPIGYAIELLDRGDDHN